MIEKYPEYSEFEIVGFDSIPKLECGRSLPLLRHKKTNRFFMVTRMQNHLTQELSLHEDEIAAWQKEGRITKLTHALPAFQDATVVYVKEEFLRLGKIKRPKRFGNQSLNWHKLSDHSPFAWITLVPVGASVELLDSWGSHFRDLTMQLLEQFLIKRDKRIQQQAEKTAEIARAAAINARLRCEIFIRHALAIMFSDKPERFDNIYSIIVSREHPQWNYEDFVSLTKHLGVFLQIRCDLQHQRNSNSDSIDLPNRPDTWQSVIDAASKLSRLKDTAEQVRRARNLANMHPIATKEQIEIGNHLVFKTEDAELKPDHFPIFAPEPATYFPKVVKRINDTTYLDTNEFIKAACLFDPEKDTSFPLTNCASKHLTKKKEPKRTKQLEKI